MATDPGMREEAMAAVVSVVLTGLTFGSCWTPAIPGAPCASGRPRRTTTG